MYAIAPPIIILSHFFNKELITLILSETLNPPKIAKYGLSSHSTTFERLTTSFSTKKPIATSFPSAFKISGTPYVDA